MKYIKFYFIDTKRSKMHKIIYILNHKNPGPSEEKKIKLTYFRLCVKYDKKQKHLNELTRFLEQKVILFFFFFLEFIVSWRGVDQTNSQRSDYEEPN